MGPLGGAVWRQFLVLTLCVGTHCIGRSASFAVEPTLLQHVTSPMDAERPTMRYDAERCNEAEIATVQFLREIPGSP
jgi:hypothetical protein